MKLTIRRHDKKSSGISKLQKLIDDARTLDLEQFLKVQRGEDYSFLGIGGRREDPKTKPEGSRGLTAVEEINSNGAPVVRFSDGSSYLNYDKMNDSDPIKKIFDANLKTGQIGLKTIYKPDGTTFHVVDLKARSAPAPQSAPVAAPG